jgi:type II secretory pathway component PulM
MAMIFELIIWVGVALSLVGLAGLIWSIVRVARARRTLTEDAALRAEIQKALPLNLGALLLSVLGLMMVVLGIFLG